MNSVHPVFADILAAMAPPPIEDDGECEQCDNPAEIEGLCSDCWNETNGQFGVGA